MSRLTDAAAPLVAAMLCGIRWGRQGSGNLYTDPSRGYYQPDPDLGWRYVEQGPLWLGLDVIVGLVVTAGLVYGLGAWLDRGTDREGRRRRDGLAGRALWALGLATVAIPVAAFLTGGLPEGARETRPEDTVEAPQDGITAHLSGFPAGRYTVAATAEHRAIIATVSAGGESFESRFGGLQGSWTGDPGDLHRPAQGRFTADPATVDTGVDPRSNHAREYLKVDEYGTMSLELGSITGAESAAGGGVAIAAEGQLHLMGDVLPVAVTGTMIPLLPAARERLGVEEDHAIRVTAGFSLSIAQTKLKPSASDFSAETIPVRVELILIPE